jgi:hypothetical protein
MGFFVELVLDLLIQHFISLMSANMFSNMEFRVSKRVLHESESSIDTYCEVRVHGLRVHLL